MKMDGSCALHFNQNIVVLTPAQIAASMKGVSVVATAPEAYPDQAVADIYSDDSNVDRPDDVTPEIDVLPTGSNSTEDYSNDGTVPPEYDADILEGENHDATYDDKNDGTYDDKNDGPTEPYYDQNDAIGFDDRYIDQNEDITRPDYENYEDTTRSDDLTEPQNDDLTEPQNEDLAEP